MKQLKLKINDYLTDGHYIVDDSTGVGLSSDFFCFWRDKSIKSVVYNMGYALKLYT